VTRPTDKESVAESLVRCIGAVTPEQLPPPVCTRAEELILDVAGLCVAARESDYVQALVSAWDGAGDCTALGHAGGFDAAGAALINGTAAHGEDFDDTFEGGPVHAGAVVVPAVLAACERYQLNGTRALLGIVVGAETMCRLSLVVPKAIHRAGFHPTAVLGAMASTAAVGASLGLQSAQLVNALGVAGSMAGGIIEYLAEGAWTKRLHAGWAAQIGLRTALMGKHDFVGPRTVFEGTHGLFHGFAHTASGDFGVLIKDFGTRWYMETTAFKPYACGTMAHPYIDCGRRLAADGVRAEDVVEIECEVGEGTVHRLWEPLAVKQAPPNAYAAKFSTPFCIAVGFVTGDAGLEAFTQDTVRDPRTLALAAKIRYKIDPENPYPKKFTGHLRAVLRDGRVVEHRQDHFRGGPQERLTPAELEHKFARNVVFGGWPQEKADSLRRTARGLFNGNIDLGEFRA
jgi:2-methylcitrate dehydratase PrpD